MTARLDAPPRDLSDTADGPVPSPARPRGHAPWRARGGQAAALLVWAGCVAYAAAHLRHGWVPHDAGALGESARRVLQGQLPHRDFDAIYTGGLSMLNAAAFRLLGTSVLTMRIVLLGAFAAWLGVVYAIAKRLATRAWALAAMALAAASSIPVYPEAMPSWYNLFLATAGVWALLRALESGRARWLFAAGVCGALSCLVKITGLYFVAAALLGLAFHEQRGSRAHPERGADRAGSWAVTIASSAFVLVLLALVRRDLTPATAMCFVLPGTALAAVLVRREWQWPAAPWRDRLRAAGRLLGPFAAGLALPVAAFLVPYARSGSLDALARGLFVLPFRRLEFARVQPHGLMTFVGIVAAVVAAPWLARGVSAFTRRAAVAMLGAALLAAPFAAVRGGPYALLWGPLHLLVPLVVVWGSVRLLRRGRGADARSDERLYLLLAAAAMASLIEFPFAAPVYFFYALPLGLLAALPLARDGGPTTRRLAPIAAAAALAFTVLRIHPASIHTMGIAYRPDDQAAPLALPRGGIDVSPADSAEYGTLVRVLRAHAAGEYTYATPDCPEVYFLSGLRNPTRTIFDFFDARAGRTTRILDALRRHEVRVVALDTKRSFSGAVPADLAAALAARYPASTRVGDFIVRWRE